MSKDITNTERLTNELLLETYKPLLVVKLSKSTTLRLSSHLKEFATDINKKTGYEVLLFPDEDTTSVDIVSVCKSENIELEKLKEDVYNKYERSSIGEIPFTKIKDIIKKRNSDG